MVSFIIKIVSTRKPIVSMDTPKGFSKESREMWWNLMKECTHLDPKYRPSMPDIVDRLSSINNTIRGINFQLQCSISNLID